MKLWIIRKKFDFFFLNENLNLIFHSLFRLIIMSTFSNLKNIQFANFRFFEMYLNNVFRINFAFDLKSIECSIISIILTFLTLIAKQFFHVYNNFLILIIFSIVFVIKLIVMSFFLNQTSITNVFSLFKFYNWNFFCVKNSIFFFKNIWWL